MLEAAQRRRRAPLAPRTASSSPSKTKQGPRVRGSPLIKRLIDIRLEDPPVISRSSNPVVQGHQEGETPRRRSAVALQVVVPPVPAVRAPRSGSGRRSGPQRPHKDLRATSSPQTRPRPLRPGVRPATPHQSNLPVQSHRPVRSRRSSCPLPTEVKVDLISGNDLREMYSTDLDGILLFFASGSARPASVKLFSSSANVPWAIVSEIVLQFLSGGDNLFVRSIRFQRSSVDFPFHIRPLRDRHWMFVSLGSGDGVA